MCKPRYSKVPALLSSSIVNDCKWLRRDNPSEMLILRRCVKSNGDGWSSSSLGSSIMRSRFSSWQRSWTSKSISGSIEVSNRHRRSSLPLARKRDDGTSCSASIVMFKRLPDPKVFPIEYLNFEGKRDQVKESSRSILRQVMCGSASKTAGRKGSLVTKVTYAFSSASQLQGSLLSTVSSLIRMARWGEESRISCSLKHGVAVTSRLCVRCVCRVI